MTGKPAGGPHELSRHPLYGIWAGMMAGCYSRNSPQYPGCGSQGVTVFGPWHDPAVFFRDIEWLIGPRPPGGTIGRARANAGYGPGTIRWVIPPELPAEQQPGAEASRKRPRRQPVPQGGARTGTLYSCWWRLARRCPDEVYPAWHDWHVFRTDIARLLGARPEGYQFGRIDSHHPYGPGNIAWMTPAEQFRRAQQAQWGASRQPALKHGMYRHPLYRIWKRLIREYPERTHPAWSDVRVFVKEIEATIGQKPAGAAFRLVSPDGDYVPGNVFWGRRGGPGRH